MPTIRPYLTASEMLALFALLSLALLPAPAGAKEDLPRYDLPVGRVLTYSHKSEAKKEDGTAADGSWSDVRATVVAANADGSRRVVVRHTFRYGEQPEEVNVAMFDVLPDGRATRLGRWNPDVSETQAFPLLPPDAAAAKGSWKGPQTWNGTVLTYTAAPSQSGDEFVFAAAGDGPLNRVYAVTDKHTNRFDRRKGVIVGSETELTQGHGTKQTTRSVNRLVKDETIAAARAARLAAEYGKLFEAEAACLALLNRINDEPGEAEKLAARAKEVLAAAAKDVRDPEVAAEFQRLIKRHAENGGYDVEDAQRRLARIGKPLDDWEATDLDGRKWSRDGLKGKVVVMDFWYRGCGWCIFAMPELKKLAADYKGRDVVVLGMNTDRKEEDAQFVVEAMGLEYPQARAGDFAKRLGVTSFPTFIVVDRSGVVRGIHSGFRPDFGKSLATRIDELLKEKPEPTGVRGSRTNP